MTDQGKFGFATPSRPASGGLHPYEIERPPHNGTEPSMEAAEKIAPAAASLRSKVLEYLKGRGAEGATGEEIEEATGIKHQTLGPRLRDLVSPKSGPSLAKDSGMKRKTRSGVNAIVWVAVGA